MITYLNIVSIRRECVAVPLTRISLLLRNVKLNQLRTGNFAFLFIYLTPHCLIRLDNVRDSRVCFPHALSRTLWVRYSRNLVRTVLYWRPLLIWNSFVVPTFGNNSVAQPRIPSVSDSATMVMIT